jgi:UDP-N-acetylmuramate dehydrogenase
MSVLIQKNISLKNLNWWKVGGAAEFFAEPKNIHELKEVYAWGVSKNMQTLVLSGGSNVLIADNHVQGLTISLRNFKSILSSIVGERCVLSALSGTPKADAARFFLQNKLMPAVFLTGIPGDLGGGVVMNAGIGENIKPREFCEIVDEIVVLKPDLSLKTYKSSELNWDYRHSHGWQPGIITEVTLSWPNEPNAQVPTLVREASKKRVATQPLNEPSCGSTFRNPPGDKAGRLIEASGLKGYQIGGAQVSNKHANFIVNTGSATAKDIAALITHIQNTVKEKTGITLETEIVRFGF